MSSTSDTKNQLSVEREAVLAALQAVMDPDLNKNIVELGFVKNLSIQGGKVAFDVELTTPACPVKDMLHDQAVDVVKAVPWVTEVKVNMTSRVRSSINVGAKAAMAGMQGVKNVIAVASGKGGVGKSTVATNLALALAQGGAQVGLLDADVYGPSVAKMLGGNRRPSLGSNEGMIQPVAEHGVRFISMGVLIDKDTPVVWRGPMATRLVQQFLGQVEWGELDYLIVDLPPGTGDVQLTLTQTASLTGAVIVTTPQEVAVSVTLRGLRMFEQVRVPILGVVENMSGFMCPHCQESTHVFPTGSVKKVAAELGIEFLGAIPLDPAVALAGDAGQPVIGAGEQGPIQSAFNGVAGNVVRQVSVVNEKTNAMTVGVKEIKVVDHNTEVHWQDGHVSRFPHRSLRLDCPCALCLDEWTGEKRVESDKVPLDVKPLSYRYIGRYAVQIQWSDGHKTGIYPFTKLRLMDATVPEVADEPTNVVDKPLPSKPMTSSSSQAKPKKTRWQGMLQLLHIIDETPDVRSFHFGNPDGKDLPFEFLPGQFVTLTTDIDGKLIKRSFSIASSPCKRHYVELTVKREEHGLMSTYLFETLKVGALCKFTAPHGFFTFTGSESKCIVLIGGGVGVTPLMSVVRYLCDIAWLGDIYLFCSFRTMDDIIYCNELIELDQRFNNLYLTITLTRERPAIWKGQCGHFTKADIESRVANVKQSQLHVCGPRPMIDAFKGIGLELGLEKQQIKTEVFGAQKNAKKAGQESTE